MKPVNCTKSKFDRGKKRIDYQARNQGPGITFLQLKAWTVRAEGLDDKIKAMRLREWFNW